MTQNVLVKMVLESVCKYSIETVIQYCKEKFKKWKIKSLLSDKLSDNLQVSITQIQKYG